MFIFGVNKWHLKAQCGKEILKTEQTFFGITIVLYFFTLFKPIFGWAFLLTDIYIPASSSTVKAHFKIITHEGISLRSLLDPVERNYDNTSINNFKFPGIL